MVEAAKMTDDQKKELALAKSKEFLSKNVSSLDDIEIKDISGFSNTTYLITKKNYEADKDIAERIIVRFFESQASDFGFEREIFKMMGEKKLGPKALYTDEKVRVEEAIHGRNLTSLELRSPHLMKLIAEKLCDLNYDPDMTAKAKEMKGADHCFIKDFLGENGWFSLYKGMREASSWAAFPDATAAALQKKGDDLVRNESFAKEFQELIPADAENVFSHNDFQENNVLLKYMELDQPIFIDFEFSSMNLRGHDLAQYICECMIDYTHDGELPYKIYYEFDLEEFELQHLFTSYLSRYHSKFYKGTQTLSDYLSTEIPILREQVKKYILAINLMWAFGSYLLAPDFEKDPFRCTGYYTYASSRLEMFEYYRKKYGSSAMPSVKFS